MVFVLLVNSQRIIGMAKADLTVWKCQLEIFIYGLS